METTDTKTTIQNILDILSGQSSIKTDSTIKVDNSVYVAIGLIALLLLFVVLIGIYAAKHA